MFYSRRGQQPSICISPDCEAERVYGYHPYYLGHGSPELCRRVELVTDRSGFAYQYFYYAPFGDVLIEQNVVYGTFDSRWTFNGKEIDKETGLGYYGARYYDVDWSGPALRLGLSHGLSLSKPCRSPAEGWLSVDPLYSHPNQIDKSPYAFAWNNPVKYTDPDGRCPKCPDEVYLPLADLAYHGEVGDVSSNGWTIIQVDEDPETGYRGVLYQGTYGGSTEYIYAMAGSQDGTDAVEDFWQLFGLSYQYIEAYYRAKQTSMDYEGVSFTGHSLGGGLASAAALSVEDGKAVTFNAAGLSNATKEFLGIQDSKANITSYVVQGEIIDYYQSLAGFKAEGSIIYLPASYMPQSPGLVDNVYRTKQRYNNHMMNVVIQKFKAQQR